MNYEEFLEKVYIIAEAADLGEEIYTGDITDNYKYNQSKKERDKIKQEKNTYLYKEWIIGGAEGGNCWGDEAQDYTNTVEEKDKEILLIDLILKEIAPTISYLEYKNISKHVQFQNRSQAEYYGNYTDYSCCYINCKDIFNTLAEIGCITV